MTDHFLFAGLRALALAGVLSGGGARSAIEQTEKLVTANSCAAFCEAQHPEGLRALNDSVKAACACYTCSEACAQSVCIEDETPSDACLPCYQEGLINSCVPHQGHFVCNGDCSALLACITACPTN